MLVSQSLSTIISAEETQLFWVKHIKHKTPLSSGGHLDFFVKCWTIQYCIEDSQIESHQKNISSASKQKIYSYKGRGIMEYPNMSAVSAFFFPPVLQGGHFF